MTKTNHENYKNKSISVLVFTFLLISVALAVASASVHGEFAVVSLTILAVL